ncbi:MAG: EAL domain-containing protein [Magnetococcales bacterium]|nr:EAL domain-containing protein [Magnetococcales bacterium]
MKLLDSLPFRIKLLLILLIPLVGLAALGGAGIHEKRLLMQRMERMNRFTGLVIRISDLVHDLQKERGMSAGYLGSGGSRFQVELARQRGMVDERVARIRPDAGADHGEIGREAGGGLQAALDALQGLPAERERVDGLEADVNRILDAYNGIIEHLLLTVHHLSSLAATVEIASRTRNYHTFLQGKEQAGLERAIITNALSTRRFSSRIQLRFHGLVAGQATLFGMFRALASPEKRAMLDEIMATPEVREVERMRELLFAADPPHGPAGIDAQAWFDVVTMKIDHLKNLEDRLAGELLARSAEVRNAAKRSFLAYSLFSLACVGLAVGFGLVVVRGLRDKTDRILALNERVAAGDLNARIPLGRDASLDELDRIADSLNIMVEGLENAMRAHRQAMITLASRENQIRSVVDTAPDAILSLNREGMIESINPVGENLFGYYPGSLPGRSIDVLIPGFRPERKQPGREHLNIEMEGVCQDEGTFPVEISLSRFTDEVGKPRFTLIVKDITERKQVKNALAKAYAELEERVRERTRELEMTNKRLFAEIDERIRAEQGLVLAAKVFETAAEGIVITDAQVRIIKVNEAFTAISGYSAEELFGTNPKRMQSGRHDAEFYKAMWKGIRETGSWSGEIWNRRKNGEVFPQRLSISTVWNSRDELTHYVGIFADITHLKETERRLERMAYFDALTQLPNRLLFRDRLQHELDKKTRHDFQVAVLFIDLDRFKHVNDSLGHSAGDQLLVEVAERIRKCLRKYDTAARLGGDEFAAIITGLKSGRDAAPVARKIIESLKNSFMLSGHEVFIGGSIGISIFPVDGEDFETLTKHADIAMYKAKESGRGVFKFFGDAFDTGVHNQLALENKLRQGLKNDEFVVYYQPKVDLATGAISGMESLVRWIPRDGAMVSPAQFIPLAEETGLILALGAWILREACEKAAHWRREGYPVKMAVNLSAMQFQKSDLLEVVRVVLEETGLPPDALELEITESMVMGNVEKSIERMNSLKSLGLTLAVDDFGTGYSSLNYLKRFPIDTLKIDQSFVRDLSRAQGDLAIVLAIISLGQALGLDIVAEGVETREQVVILKEKGCHEMQGYFFSKPLPADGMSALLREGKNLNHLMRE